MRKKNNNTCTNNKSSETTVITPELKVHDFHPQKILAIRYVTTRKVSVRLQFNRDVPEKVQKQGRDHIE